MNKTVTITAALAIAAGLSAQWGGAPPTKTTVKIATINGLAVLATTDAGTGSTVSQGIPNDTDVTARGAFVRAATMNSHASAHVGGSYSWHLGSGATLSDSGAAHSYTGKEKGTAATANGDDKKATASPHSVLVHFDVPENEEVVIVATFSGFATTGAKGGGEIDVGNDQSAEVSVVSTAKPGTTSKEVKVKAGKNGIDVLLTTSGDAANSGTTGARYESRASVWCKRTPKTIQCTITPYDERNDPDSNPKTGCGGDLAGSTGTSGTSRWVRLNLSNAAKSSVGIFIIGAKEAEGPLPGTKCKLLVEVGLYSAFNTTSMGTASHYVSVSAALKGVVFAQDVILTFGQTGLEVSSSNGLKIECKEV